jgi:hypothetical protein
MLWVGGEVSVSRFAEWLLDSRWEDHNMCGTCIREDARGVWCCRRPRQHGALCPRCRGRPCLSGFPGTYRIGSEEVHTAGDYLDHLQHPTNVVGKNERESAEIHY